MHLEIHDDCHQTSRYQSYAHNVTGGKIHHTAVAVYPFLTLGIILLYSHVLLINRCERVRSGILQRYSLRTLKA